MLFHDFAVYFSSAASRIGLVGINMHRQRVAVAYADNHIAKNQASAIRIQLYGNDLTVLYAQSLSIFRSSMDMALRGNYALGDLDFALRANDLTCAASCNITRLSHGSGYTDGTGVR